MTDSLSTSLVVVLASMPVVRLVSVKIAAAAVARPPMGQTRAMP
jgi:hypothetical protein